MADILAKNKTDAPKKSNDRSVYLELSARFRKKGSRAKEAEIEISNYLFGHALFGLSCPSI